MQIMTDNARVTELGKLSINSKVLEMLQENQTTNVQHGSIDLTKSEYVQEVDELIPDGNVLASAPSSSMVISAIESNVAREDVDMLTVAEDELLRLIENIIVEGSCNGDGLENELHICACSENDLDDKMEHIAKEKNYSSDTEKQVKCGKVT